MAVLERFLKYVTFDTTSDEDSPSVPSTEKQRVFAEYLAQEMRAIGLSDVRLDEFGYLYGVLPASAGLEHLPALGLIAHMDTSPAVSGADVKPAVIRYGGGDIVLQSGAVTELALFPFLSRYVGEDLVVTDGTTLLGADDKAGIAEILSACEYLVAHPEIKHRRLAIGFTPDEEIGRGADHFDVEHFGAAVAYTVDGGALGEIEYENFNAASACVVAHGVNIHPGTAKGRMKNAILMMQDFLAGLPQDEIPACTEGYEGFYHVTDLSGCESEASLSLLIRDHDWDRFLARKSFLTELVARLNEKWGANRFSLEIKDSYYNMKEKILPHMELVETAEAAMRAVGAEPCIVPIRGGTDGARLSYMDLPCPNLSTGGENFHGVHELIPVESMRKMVGVLVELAKAENA